MTAGSCQIHLRDDARRRAADALFPIPAFPAPSAFQHPDDYISALNAHTQKYADDLQARAEFTGPHFTGCVAQVDFLTPGWVHVELQDATQYSYPADDVARIKVYRR